MISSQLASVREVINGWGVITTGIYGTDYLFHAAVAKNGIGCQYRSGSYPYTYIYR
jgi:hypothetical protein